MAKAVAQSANNQSLRPLWCEESDITQKKTKITKDLFSGQSNLCLLRCSAVEICSHSPASSAVQKSKRRSSAALQLRKLSRWIGVSQRRPTTFVSIRVDSWLKTSHGAAKPISICSFVFSVLTITAFPGWTSINLYVRSPLAVVIGNS